MIRKSSCADFARICGAPKAIKTPKSLCILFEQLRLLLANTLDMPQFCRHNHMLDGEA